MLSLKYKNYVSKNVLEEANTTDVDINNVKVIQQMLNHLRSLHLPNSTVYAHSTKFIKKYYIFEMVSFIPRDNNIDIHVTELAKNLNSDSTTDEFYILHTLELNEESSIYTFNYEDKKIIIIKEDDEDVEFQNLPFFKDKPENVFNGITSVRELKTSLIDKRNTILSSIKNNNKINSKNNKNPSVSISSSEHDEIKNDPTYLEILGEEEIKKLGISDDAKPSSNSNKIEILSKTKNNKDKITFMFNPQNLIGDDLFRKINIISAKVQSTLQNFDNLDIKKYKKLTPELIASDIVSKTVSNIKQHVNVNQEIINSQLSNFEGYKKSNLNEKDFNSLVKQALNMVRVNPPEIFSPIAILKGGVNWTPEVHKAINEIFGDDASLANGVIQYPQGRNYHLIDSMAIIQNNKDKKYRQLGVSTKGGLTGQGMQASLTSIIQMLINSDIKFNGWGYNEELKNLFMTEKSENNIKTNKKTITRKFNYDFNTKEKLEELIINFVNQYFTDIGKTIFKSDNCGTALIILFGICSKWVHNDILKLLGNCGSFFNVNFDKTDKPEEVLESINKRHLVNNVVMKTLDSWKYKFAQVNCKTNSSNSEVYYTYEIQYPAHFEGTVELKYGGDGETVRFHIVGKVA